MSVKEDSERKTRMAKLAKTPGIIFAPYIPLQTNKDFFTWESITIDQDGRCEVNVFADNYYDTITINGLKEKQTSEKSNVC